MNLYYFGTALCLSSLYMSAALGDSICIKNGDFNLGGEAQIYAGGFVCAVLLTKLNFLPVVAGWFLAFCISFLISGIIVLISALLKRFSKADFLFTSFIISAAIIPYIDSLVTGAFRGKTGNLLATEYIDQKFRFISILPPSALSIFFVVAAALCVAFYFFINRTYFGRQVCIHGISKEFFRYAGFDNTKVNFTVAFISGGMHGLCGASCICGMYYTCHAGFYSGMGWNSLTACLIAGSNPLYIIPSSVFMALITIYANRFALIHNFGFDISGIMQACILFLVAFPLIKKRS